jgi:hypothetical protein
LRNSAGPGRLFTHEHSFVEFSRSALPRRPDQSGTGSNASLPLRDRRQKTLFIDARKLGTLIDRVHRELTDAGLEKITSAYHAWRGDESGSARAPSAVSGALAMGRSSRPANRRRNGIRLARWGWWGVCARPSGG